MTISCVVADFTNCHAKTTHKGGWVFHPHIAQRTPRQTQNTMCHNEKWQGTHSFLYIILCYTTLQQFTFTRSTLPSY